MLRDRLDNETDRQREKTSPKDPLRDPLVDGLSAEASAPATATEQGRTRAPSPVERPVERGDTLQDPLLAPAQPAASDAATTEPGSSDEKANEDVDPKSDASDVGTKTDGGDPGDDSSGDGDDSSDEGESGGKAGADADGGGGGAVQAAGDPAEKGADGAQRSVAKDNTAVAPVADGGETKVAPEAQQAAGESNAASGAEAGADEAPQIDGAPGAPPAASAPAVFQAVPISVPPAPELRRGQERRLRRKSGVELDAPGHHEAVAAALHEVVGAARQRYDAFVADAEARAEAIASALETELESLSVAIDASRGAIDASFASVRGDVDAEADAARAQIRAQADAGRAAVKSAGSVGYGKVGARRRKTVRQLGETATTIGAELDAAEKDTGTQLVLLTIDGRRYVTDKNDNHAKAYKARPSGAALNTSPKSESRVSEPLEGELLRELGSQASQVLRSSMVPDLVSHFEALLIGSKADNGGKPSQLGDTRATLAELTNAEAVQEGSDVASKAVWSTLNAARTAIGTAEKNGVDAVSTLQKRVHEALDQRLRTFQTTLDQMSDAVKTTASSEREALQRAAWEQTGIAAGSLRAVVDSAVPQVLAAAGTPTFRRVDGLLRVDQAGPALDSAHAKLAEVDTELATALAESEREARESTSRRVAGLSQRVDKVAETGTAEPGEIIEALRANVARIADDARATAESAPTRVPSALAPITDNFDAKGRGLAQVASEKGGTLAEAHATYVTGQMKTARTVLKAQVDTQFDTLVDQLFTKQNDALASNLRGRSEKALKAMKGANTNEPKLWAALDKLSPTQGWALEAFFGMKDGYSLKQWLKGDLSGDGLSAAYKYLNGDHVDARMLSMEYSSGITGFFDSSSQNSKVMRESMKRMSKGDLEELVLPKYKERRDSLKESLDGVHLEAFEELDTGDLAGMHATYFLHDIEKARKDQDIYASSDAFSDYPPEMHDEIMEKTAGKIKEKDASIDPDVAAADVVVDYIADDYEEEVVRHSKDGPHTETVQREGFKSRGADKEMDILSQTAHHGAGSAESTAAWIDYESTKAKELGFLYDVEKGRGQIERGYSGAENPEEFQEQVRQQLKDEYDIDSEVLAKQLSVGGFLNIDGQALAELVGQGEVTLKTAIDLLLKKEHADNQDELQAFLASVPADELEALWKEHPKLKEEVLEGRQGRKKQEMEWATEGAPRNDREFYQRVCKKYEYARGNTFNGHGGRIYGMELDVVYDRLQGLIAGRPLDAVFDENGRFVGEYDDMIEFRMIVEKCDLNYEAYQEAKEDDANFVANMVGILLSVALAPFTGGASLLVLATIAAASAAVVVGMKAYMLGGNYTLGEMADDFIDEAASGLVTAGFGAGGKGLKSLGKHIDPKDAKILKNLSDKVHSTTDKYKKLKLDSKAMNTTLSLIEDTASDMAQAPFVKMLKDAVKENNFDFDVVDPMLQSLQEVPTKFATDMLSNKGAKLITPNKGLLSDDHYEKLIKSRSKQIGTIPDAVDATKNYFSNHATGSFNPNAPYDAAIEEAMTQGVRAQVLEEMATLIEQNRLYTNAVQGHLEPEDHTQLAEMAPDRREAFFNDLPPAVSSKVRSAYEKGLE